jgi:serine protease Do
MNLIIPLLVVMSLLIGACGGSEPEQAPEKAPAEKESGLKQPSSDPGMVTSLEDVRAATVRIEAEGTFVDPQDGMTATWAGSGSGFIIDSSGIAVTNNHVVTGAALLRVWVADENSPRNARILGVSECADLAVIDIDGPDLPYLDWHDGDVNVGLEVYATGFPLGDPEYTLTKGIVSKANADGESTWSSIDYVLEHDARINPGNSGGPLVDEQGRVVAVNYASLESANQYFAIKAEDALPVIEKLREGTHVDSIGVNGSAFVSNDGGFSGIWVYSVESGSPADEAGISGGDIITSLEGGADDTLGVEIFRFASGETLEGQLNGRTLAVTGSTGLTSGGSSGGSSGSGYGSYTTLLDDTGSLEVSVPSVWNDVDGADWTDDGGLYHYSIWAAPNIDDFHNTWDTPGLIYEITPLGGQQFGGHLNFLENLSSDFEEVCTFDAQEDYDDGAFEGTYRLYTDCAGTSTAYFILSAYPAGEPDGYSINLELQLVSDADWDVVDTVLDSFNVVSPVGQAGPGGVAYEGDGYDSYMWINDDYNSVTMQAPMAWNDNDGAPWNYEGEVIGGMVSASPDLDGFFSTWDVPGITFAASDDLASQIGYLELLDGRRSSFMDACELDGRYDYEDTLYRGKYDVFTKCGGPGGANMIQLAAVSKDDQFAFLIFIQAQIVEDRDWEVLDQVFNTFEVVGQLP